VWNSSQIVLRKSTEDSFVWQTGLSCFLDLMTVKKEYEILHVQHRVVGSNPKNVNGGGRESTQPKFAPALQKRLPVNQGANSMTLYSL